MEYFPVSEARPGGDAICSDNECPCGWPGASIPRGSGYLYVSKTVVDFRRDARSEREAQQKIARMQPAGAVLFLDQNVAAPILMCEQGARKRNLELNVAAEDARHWWRTGLAPLRATPFASAPSIPVSPTPVPSLFSAARNGEKEKFEELLAKGADVQARESDGGTALICAAYAGHGEIVDALLARSAEVDAQDDKSSTALMYAARSGHTAIVESLLAKGAEVNVQATNNGTAALILAASWGHTEIVKALLERKARPNTQNKEGNTALILAAGNGHSEIVTSLLANGADVNISGKGGTTALMQAGLNGSKEIVDQLLANGAAVNGRDADGDTALTCAAGKGHKEAIDSLLSNGAEVNVRNNDGTTALILAARNGYREVVESLLAKGAEVNVQATNNGNSALILASDFGHSEIVGILLDHAADVDARNRDGNTALILACGKSGHVDIVDRLLAKGAGLNVQNTNFGNTALLCAASWGHAEIVERLLACHAELNVRNNKGNTALLLASGEEPQLEALEKLLAAGEDVNALNDNGTSALIMAASWGHVAIVDRLLAAGADLRIRDNDGDTAQMVADRGGKKEVASNLAAWAKRKPMPLPRTVATPVWRPTHLVPPGGMAAWPTPDPALPPMVQLAERLDLVVEANAGAWAQVRAVNGWRGWVDGRLLVARPPIQTAAPAAQSQPGNALSDAVEAKERRDVPSPMKVVAKPSAPVAKPVSSAAEAMARVDAAYERLAGESMSLGAKLITQSLVSEAPGDYALCPRAETVRLGILRYFALFAAMGTKGVAAVVSDNDIDFLIDKHGPNAMTSADFLDAFGMQMCRLGEINLAPSLADMELDRHQRLLVISNAYEWGRHLLSVPKRLRFPLIEDDGKTVKAVQLNIATAWGYQPLKR